MKFYHGTDNPDLKILTTNFSNEGYVFLTKSYPFAVLYGGSSVRFWAFNKETGKLVIREVCEDGLKKMYKGKTFYIYTTEDIEQVEEYEYCGAKNYKTKQNVKLESKETIVDAYDKIINLYESGELEILFWNKLSSEQKEKCQNKIKSTLCADMKLNYTKFKKDYDVLVKLFPETALTEEEIENIKS